MENIIDFFMDDKNGVHKRESFLKKNHPKLFNNIVNYKLNVNKNYPLIQKIYNYIFMLEDIPKCYCGNDVKFNDTINKGYRKYCSVKCGRNDSDVKDKIKKKMLKIYGVEHPLYSKEIRNKIKQTNLKLYGCENPQQNKLVRKRTEETNLELYGNKNIFQSEKIKKKIKQTISDKYNVENISQLSEVKKKKIITSNKNYGVDYYTQTEEYKLNQLNKFIMKFNDLNITIHDLDKQILKITNHCKIHNEFLIKKDTLYNRYIIGKQKFLCTNCLPVENTHKSNIHLEIKTFLDNNNINYIENERFEIAPYEIDFYIPNVRLGIEINGSYYHSDLFKDKNYHQNKTLLAKMKNILIFHLWDFDYYSNTELIISMLSNKIQICQNKIFARKTKLVEINDKITKEFLDANHLQKWCVSKYRYGLYYNNELISVMTFGSLRKNVNKKNEKDSFELLRFCTKKNYLVIGGAQKLLNFFENKIKPKIIISYSNNDISDGNLYKTLGFNEIKITKPSYWWIKNMIKFNRFSFRKDKLVKMGYDNHKTEDIIMRENNYLKVYNSGNVLYEKRL